MISKLLFNINNLFYYLFMAIVVSIILYLIYKMFILENDVYLLNEKIYKLECNGGQCQIPKNKINNDEINMNEIIMSQIFDNDDDEEQPIINKDIDIINIEDLLPEQTSIEPIFDLKKETVMDDKESIISSNNLTKKKLSKLNLDKLKEKCVELELNSEGTKAQLIDRIFEKEMS
jgi:hypothetical protein